MGQRIRRGSISSGSGFNIGLFHLGLGLQHGLSGRVFPLRAGSKGILDLGAVLFPSVLQKTWSGSNDLIQ